MNNAVIVGNLGHDPSLRETANGTPVCNFSVATSERIGGEDKTEWHNIVTWDKTAEHCKKYLAKGRKVAVQGRLLTRKWQDKNGLDRYTTEIHANRVEFLTPKSELDATGEMAQNNNTNDSASRDSDDLDNVPF